MSEVKEVRLGDVLKVHHGFAFKSSEFSDDLSYPTIVTPGNFSIGGGFKDAKPKTFSGDFPPSYELAPGDLVVTMTDLSKQGDTLGMPAVIPSDRRYLHNQRIGLVEVLEPNEVSKSFLAYYLRTRVYKEYVLGTASGSTVRHTSPSRIEDFVAHLPKINTQHAIAEVLGALDDKIAANNKTIQLADSLTSALAEDAFSRGNFVPLASIAEITMGNSPKGETLNEDGEGLAFFQGIRDFGVRYPQERVSSTAPTRFAKELDTLFSVRAPVGTVNLAGMPCSIGRGISALSSKTETPYALFQAVRASKIWERYNAEGTVFGSINRKQLEQSEIPWVFHSERYELESTLAGLERLLRTATVMNETLSSIRDTLLPQLMSGKLRVQDAETALEGVL